MTRDKFWSIVNNQQKYPLKEILAKVLLPKDINAPIQDPDGIIFDCLSIVTRNFILHNVGSENEQRRASRLYAGVLSDDIHAPYSFMLQASLYREKQPEDQREAFDRELDWKKANDPVAWAWIKECFERIR